MRSAARQRGWAMVVVVAVLLVVAVLCLWIMKARSSHRAPRLLPNGYTVSRYTSEGVAGWGLSPPNDLMSTVQPLDENGRPDLEWWYLTRAALAGDIVIVVGRKPIGARKEVPICFELDTKTRRITMLASEADAQRRVSELQFGEHGAAWVDLDALPRAK